MYTDKSRPSRFYRRLTQLFKNSFNHLLFNKAACLLLFSACIPVTCYALSLHQAEILALNHDPLIASQQATARALMDESVSEGSLPDPQLRVGLFNLPVESLSTTQEPTTQFALGVQQMFPRGDSLELKQQNSEWLSKSAAAMAQDTQRKTLRDLRETFLNLYYEIGSVAILRETSDHFTNLVKITEAQYASGRANQQDVIRADLELSRLEDRTTNVQSKIDEYRAQLSLWIGDEAFLAIEDNIPRLPDLPASYDVNTLLTQHPSILMESAKIKASGKMTAMAKQDYKPGYNAFIEYRRRNGTNSNGSDREDMMAAMVTMDIPLFTENRQDKKVSASEEKALAAKLLRDDKLRQIKQQLYKDMAIYKRLGEREKIYREELLESAKNNASASINAYQSGVSEFTTLMRARITELDVRLADLRIRVDRKRAQARLLYITGEQQ